MIQFDIVKEVLRRVEAQHDGNVRFEYWADDSWAITLQDEDGINSRLYSGVGLSDVSVLFEELRS